MFDRLFEKLNNLNPRQLVLLAGIVMLLMFTTIFAFLSWWTERDDTEQNVEPPAQVETVNKKTVVVAKVDIPPLTAITAEMLQTKEIAEDLVPEDALESIEKVLGISAKTEIFAGDVITARKLETDMKNLSFVGSIPPDCRAVSISVNEITGVDGFAKPGDKVDLILVETDKNLRATSSILLQDVLLLSINKNMDKINRTTTTENGQVMTAAIENPSIATFALPPEEVLRLISASKLGEIYLMLRPNNPTARYYGRNAYTMDSINRPKEEPKPEKKEEVKPEPEKVEPPKEEPKEEKPVEVTPPEIKPETFEIIYGDLPSTPKDEKDESPKSSTD